MSAAVWLIFLAWVGLGNAGEVQETTTGVGIKAAAETSFAIRTYETMGFSNQAWYGTSDDSRIELFSNQPGVVAIYLESELMGGLLFDGRDIQTGQFFDAKSGIHVGFPQQRRFQVNDLGIGDTLTDIEIVQSQWVNYEWEFFWAKFTMRLQGEVIMQGEIRYRVSGGEEEANQAPTVEVAPGLVCKVNEWIPLYARANDDLRPFGVPLTARWEQISGPGQVSLESSDKLNTRASFPSLGTYQLRVTASDSEFSDSADVTVYVTKNPRTFSRRLGASASEYAAVIARDGTSVGYLRVLVNGSGTFTAQLWLEGEVRRFKGTLVAGAWNPFDSTDMRLRFALTDDGEALNCSISRFTWESQFVAREVAPSVLERTGATASRAGAYTFMIVPQGSPLGSDAVGAGRITISPGGYFKMSATFRNGRKYSAAGPLSADESFAWAANVVNEAGSGPGFGYSGFSGFVEAKSPGELDNATLNGSFTWQPLGYSLEPDESLQLLGSAYRRPGPGQNALTLTANAATASGRVYAPWVHWDELNLTVDSRHHLAIESWSEKLAVKLQPATGLFQGTLSGGGGRRVKVQGAVLQSQRYLGGFAVDRKQEAAISFLAN